MPHYVPYPPRNMSTLEYLLFWGLMLVKFNSNVRSIQKGLKRVPQGRVNKKDHKHTLWALPN